jgi:hypothetical protein
VGWSTLSSKPCERLRAALRSVCRPAMVDPLRTGGIFRLQLASTAMGSPCPRSGGSPSAHQRQRAADASPRYTRPKPEIILHDEIASATRANRFSPSFNAVALAAPVADVVRRAVEEEQQRLVQDQLRANEKIQHRELFDGLSRCAPPWAAEYATPPAGSALRSDQVREPGENYAASIAQVPPAPAVPDLDPAGILGLPPPLQVERKPVRIDGQRSAGTAREPEVPSLLQDSRAASGVHEGPSTTRVSRVAEGADPAPSKHNMVTRNSSAQMPYSSAAADPGVSPARTLPEIVTPHKHPAHASSNPRRTQPVTPTKRKPQRGRLSEVLRLQRSLATAVWTNSVVLQDLSEPIIIVDDVDDDDGKHAVSNVDGSSSLPFQRGAVVAENGLGSGRARRAARSKTTDYSDRISRRRPPTPQRGRKSIACNMRQPELSEAHVELVSKNGRKSRSSVKSDIRSLPIHKFDRSIRSAIKTPLLRK